MTTSSDLDDSRRFPPGKEQDDSYRAPSAEKINWGQSFANALCGTVIKGIWDGVAGGGYRNCVMGIRNMHPDHTFSYINEYLYSGGIKEYSSRSIPPKKAATWAYQTNAGTQRVGTVGVVAYKYPGPNYGVLTIMWCVPFETAVWDHWYNVRLYDDGRADKNRYYDLYYGYEDYAAGKKNILTHLLPVKGGRLLAKSLGDLHVEGYLSNEKHAVMELELSLPRVSNSD